METVQYEKGLTFEKVWALTQENAKAIAETRQSLAETAAETRQSLAETAAETRQSLAETAAETQRSIAETRQSMAETRQSLAESLAETDRIVKETTKSIGALGRRFGEAVEYMVAPNLAEKFSKMGFDYQDVYRNQVITDRKHGIFTEVDVTLRNTESVMIVETKAKPDIRDVDDHIERMEKLRAYADLRGDKRKYFGAVAGVVMSENVKAYALNKGFYVIEPSGETFTITKPTGDHKPKAW